MSFLPIGNGHRDAYKDGYEQGYKDASKDAFKDGYEQGYKDGYEEGYERAAYELDPNWSSCEDGTPNGPAARQEA